MTYIICGITDMLDGFIARATHTTSQLGADLDSIADTIFVMVCLVEILPVHSHLSMYSYNICSHPRRSFY